ncbi:MAG TPA: hypothetical protein VJT82_07250 [Pyrinomonadaceae bacterium]|nr:hypothetical protein [Pyrinomonadaceae bacterium]
MLIRDSELQRRIVSLPDEQLLDIVTARRTEYRQAALDLASKELMRRRVSFELPSADEPESTPVAKTTPAGGDGQTLSRTDKVMIFLVCCLALSLSAFNLYDSGSRNPSRLMEKVVFWLHIVLLVPLIFRICVLFGKKLLDKI